MSREGCLPIDLAVRRLSESAEGLAVAWPAEDVRDKLNSIWCAGGTIFLRLCSALYWYKLWCCLTKLMTEHQVTSADVLMDATISMTAWEMVSSALTKAEVAHHCQLSPSVCGPLLSVRPDFETANLPTIQLTPQGRNYRNMWLFAKAAQ